MLYLKDCSSFERIKRSLLQNRKQSSWKHIQKSSALIPILNCDHLSIYIDDCEYLLQAAAAVRNHAVLITSGAAVSKGKAKIDGIGAKCGEIIDEYLATGAIAKIAEKRGLLN